MSVFFDRAAHSSSTVGTGTITLGSALGAVSPNLCAFQSFASAGVTNGQIVSYLILDANGAWEVGFGTYTSAGTTLTRNVTFSSNANAAINLSGSEQIFITARAEDLLSTSVNQSANQVFAGPTSGGAATPAFRALVAADLPFNGSQLSSVLGADVALNNTAAFFDGPSIAQGSVGVWFVSGTVSCKDSTGIAKFDAKLWDGTTIIATSSNISGGASFLTTISLSGIISSPAGNLRISVRDDNFTTGAIAAVSSGSGGSNICAFRIG